MKQKKTKVKATASAYGFELTLNATINSTTLSKEEMDNVKRKLKHQLSNTIAKLPYAHIYPHEVELA